MKRKGKSRAQIFALERLNSLGMSFAGVENIFYTSQDVMNTLMQYMYITGRYESDAYIYGHFRMGADGKMIMDKDLNFIENYRKNVFNLPQNTPLMPPTVAKPSEEETKKLAAGFSSGVERAVVLSPYANSTDCLLPTSLWEKLASVLLQKGFDVYTNVAPPKNGNNETPIAGTKPFVASFAALFHLAEKMRAVIGYRSGLLDYLAFSKANIIGISYFPSWTYDLRTLYPTSNAKNFYYAASFIAPIQTYLAERGVTAQIRFSHPKISSPICFSDDDIVSTVLANI